MVVLLQTDFCPFCHASAYMKSQFSIRGMVWVYINNSSLTIYIFIDIHADSDAEFKFLLLGLRTKRTMIRMGQDF